MSDTTKQALRYPPDACLPTQKRDPKDAQSAMVTLAQHYGLMPKGVDWGRVLRITIASHENWDGGAKAFIKAVDEVRSQSGPETGPANQPAPVTRSDAVPAVSGEEIEGLLADGDLMVSGAVAHENHRWSKLRASLRAWAAAKDQEIAALRRDRDAALGAVVADPRPGLNHALDLLQDVKIPSNLACDVGAYAGATCREIIRNEIARLEKVQAASFADQAEPSDRRSDSVEGRD